MTLQGKYIYVFYNPATSDTVSGLIDGNSEGSIRIAIKSICPDAKAIWVGKADDDRCAGPIHYADIVNQLTCCIYAFIDTTIGGICSGMECVPVYHPDLIREKILQYYPGAKGILIGKVNDSEIVANAIKESWIKQQAKGGQA